MNTTPNDAGGTQTPVFDPAQLAVLMEMDEGGDHSMIKEIAGQFVTDITDVMARIDAALPAGDFAAIVAAAHTVKGSAATFGLVQLQKIARELETAAKDGGNRESIPTIYASLRDAFAGGRTALGDYLAAL